MDILSHYEGMTLADLPDGEHYLAASTPDTDTYYYRQGGISYKTVIHKTWKAVMEANAEEAKEFNRTGKLSVNTKVSSMPTSVYLALYAKGIVQDKNEYAKWLNHSDNAWARTNNLRV